MIVTDIAHIPDAIAAETIVVMRPKGAIARLFAEPSLEWRAACCAELLLRGWVEIQANDERVQARAPRR